MSTEKASINKDNVFTKTGDTLYQVNGIAYMEASLKLIHLRILIVIIDHLQYAIRYKISRKKPDAAIPKVLLPEEGPLTLNGPSRKLTIPVAEFNLQPRNGGRLRNYLQELQHIVIVFPAAQKNSPSAASVFQGLIAGFSFPAYSQRVEIYMQEKMIGRLLLTEEGYTAYSKKAAISCTNKNTVRLYWLICSWRNKGGFMIKLDSFRRILALEKNYSRFDNIVTRILAPAAKELKEHFPIWFLYRTYGTGDKRLLVFKVQTRVPQDQQEAERRSIWNICFHLFHSIGVPPTKLEDIFAQVDYGDLKPFLNKAIALSSYLKELRPQPRDNTAYVRSALQSWLSDWRLRYELLDD